MPLPTGGEEDDLDLDGPDDTAPDSSPHTPATPETQREAERVSGEIVKLAQEVAIMAQTRAKLEAALGRSETMANVLEGKMLKEVPIIKHIPLVRSIPIPLEAIAGLLPVVGDVVAASAALYIVAEAHMAGVPWKEISKMLVKIATDTGLGAIPVVGDIFDFFYKSNFKNVEIFRRYVNEYIAKHESTQGKLSDAQARERFQDARSRTLSPPDLDLDNE